MRENNDSSIRVGNDDGLFGQGSGYVNSETLSLMGGELTGLSCHLLLTQRSQFFW